MNAHTRQFILPIVIIAIGVGWLLNALHVFAPVDWFWTITLATSGLLLIAVAGLDRFTAVVGPWLICASCTGLLRQTDVIAVNTEVPVLTIALGVLMFVSRLLLPRMPMWLQGNGRNRSVA